MKRYTVELTYKVVVEVEANSESEALDYAEDDETIGYSLANADPYNLEVIYVEEDDDEDEDLDIPVQDPEC